MAPLMQDEISGMAKIYRNASLICMTLISLNIFQINYNVLHNRIHQSLDISHILEHHWIGISETIYNGIPHVCTLTSYEGNQLFEHTAYIRILVCLLLCQSARKDRTKYIHIQITIYGP
jgi:hypothetical protein